MLQDPLNDALAVIKNAEVAGKGACTLRPASKLVGHVLDVMKQADYLTGFERVEDSRGPRSGARSWTSGRPGTSPRRTSVS